MKTTRQERRPANGCARCEWWKENRKLDGWGRCAAHKEKTWWQHAACSEYELNLQTYDLIDFDDEIYDDN